MAKWKSELLNWAEEHSDGQRELKVWRELITEYLEEEYLKEDGMSDEEFKQFLKEQESKEVKVRLSIFNGSDESYYLTHYEHILPINDLMFVGGVLEEETK